MYQEAICEAIWAALVHEINLFVTLEADLFANESTNDPESKIYDRRLKIFRREYFSNRSIGDISWKCIVLTNRALIFARGSFLLCQLNVLFCCNVCSALRLEWFHNGGIPQSTSSSNRIRTDRKVPNIPFVWIIYCVFRYLITRLIVCRDYC